MKDPPNPNLCQTHLPFDQAKEYQLMTFSLISKILRKKKKHHYALKSLSLCFIKVSTSSLLPVIVKASNGGIILKSPILILHASVNNGASVHINIVGAQLLQKVHYLLTCWLHTCQIDTPYWTHLTEMLYYKAGTHLNEITFINATCIYI